MQFTYDPIRQTVTTWIGGIRRTTATIAQHAATIAHDERPTAQKQQSATISGPIALAMVRAISKRRISVPTSFLNREEEVVPIFVEICRAA